MVSKIRARPRMKWTYSIDGFAIPQAGRFTKLRDA
jgi:hypothetical protein